MSLLGYRFWTVLNWGLQIGQRAWGRRFPVSRVSLFVWYIYINIFLKTVFSGNLVDIWETFAFLPRVRWDGQYHSVSTVNMKLEPGDGWLILALNWKQGETASLALPTGKKISSLTPRLKLTTNMLYFNCLISLKNLSIEYWNVSLWFY